MKSIILILGVLFILTLFGVGETVVKRLRIKKIALLTTLAVLLITLILPTYSFGNFAFTIPGFAVGLVVSTMFLFEIKNRKFLAKFLVSFLLVVLFMQIFFLIDWASLVGSAEVAWIGALGILSLVVLKICTYPKQSFAALFLAVNAAQIINGLTNNAFIVLGENVVLLALITSGIVMALTYNVVYLFKRRNKVKAFSIQQTSENN